MFYPKNNPKNVGSTETALGKQVKHRELSWEQLVCLVSRNRGSVLFWSDQFLSFQAPWWGSIVVLDKNAWSFGTACGGWKSTNLWLTKHTEVVTMHTPRCAAQDLGQRTCVCWDTAGMLRYNMIKQHYGTFPWTAYDIVQFWFSNYMSCWLADGARWIMGSGWFRHSL